MPVARFSPSQGPGPGVTPIEAEELTLCVVGLAVTIARVYARARAVGVKGLRGDDYMVIVGAIFYAVMTALSSCHGRIAWAQTNTGLTDDERAALQPESAEFRRRVIGSKLQIASWLSYSASLWALKASLLVLFLRLTKDLGRNHVIRIHVGFGLLVASWVTVVANLFLACRPFYKYWQIQPDPGNTCQPTMSNQIIWVNMSLNIVTDFYLISIPVPLLWQSSMRAAKKVGLMVLFSGGLLVAVFAMLRSILVFTESVSGARPCLWAAREVFVAVATTNLPIVFPRLVLWLAPMFSSIASSASRKEKIPSGFRTVGGGGKNGPSWLGRGPPTPNPITDFTLTSSQEDMMDRTDSRGFDAAEQSQKD